MSSTPESTRATSDFKIIGPTTFDPSQFAQYGVDAIVSEGGIYEMGTGRAGADALSQITDAVDFTPDGGDDYRVDHVVNQWYNEPIGVDCDDIGKGC